jgi:hypothetical protein
VVQATVDVLGEAVEGLILGLNGAELASTQRIADRLSAKLVVAYASSTPLSCGTSMPPPP